MTSVASAPKSAPAVSRPATPPPSSAPKLDEAVARAREGAARLLRLSLDERVALARSMQAGYLAVARESVHAACAAKGIPLGTPLEGEEWTTGPWMVVRHLRLIEQALLGLKHAGNTPVGERGQTADGRLDRAGVSGRRHRRHPVQGRAGGCAYAGRCDRPGPRRYPSPLLQGKHPRRARGARPGRRQRQRHPFDGRHHQALQRGQGLRPQDEPGERLSGSVPRARLCRCHPRGLSSRWSTAARRRARISPATRAWTRSTSPAPTGPTTRSCGARPAPSATARKREGRPITTKPVTAELGGVAPVLVVPGPYSDKELAFQAEDVASGLTFNASFDCNANRVVVLPRGWPRRDQFLAFLRAALERAADRQAYYPGARERLERFARRPRLPHRRQGRGLSALDRGAGTRSTVPATEPLFREESFAPVIAETAVGSADPAEFLEAAVRFANDRLWGTLSAGLVVHPRSMKDPAAAAAVERAIAAAALRHRDRERLVRASVRLRARRPGARIRRPRPRTSRAARAGCTTPRCWKGSRRRSCAIRSPPCPSPPTRSATGARIALMARMTALEERGELGQGAGGVRGGHAGVTMQRSPIRARHSGACLGRVVC